MGTLFEETAINGMKMRNRLARSATWEGMCERDGRPTEKLAKCYRDLAQGGVGLIITGFTFVRQEGKALPGKMGIHTDDFAGDYENLVKAVHDAGGKMAIQLVHAGGKASSKAMGRQPVAPSSIQDEQFTEMPAELTKDEISEIVTAFGEGARRAKAWGIDAVQLHGAHGYLINQFLSPHMNRRGDEYGGSIENRSRFLMDVYQKVRDTVGPDFPVFIKLTASDNLNAGLTVDDAVYAARKLSDAGIDAIEVSSGTSASGDKNPARVKINSPEKEAYNLELAIHMKDAVTCPVMVVGGFRSYDVAEKAIRNNGMDFIAMSRPLIREPDLPNRWLQGDRSPAKCISCNSCFKPATKEGGIYCVVEKKEQEKEAKQGN
jgi:2,4-dienoyl-CoA reductase-like NADH-dependent reductase (Old Yellow Enzyme family)